MVEVQETYARPYDPAHPVLCMDEQPVQLVKETRRPVPATKHHARRVDYEYERARTASIFMFAQPLAGWRQASAREHRTKSDWALEVGRWKLGAGSWALEVAAHLDGRFAATERITLVCDNLNTHTKGAFYKVFPPEVARRYVRRIEFCYTPKHGSWLNIAENELSCMTCQCLSDRRIGELSVLQDEIGAWSTDVTSTQRGVDWQMKIGDARYKLMSVYPKILV
jgi:hypothetical protein